VGCRHSQGKLPRVFGIEHEVYSGNIKDLLVITVGPGGLEELSVWLVVEYKYVFPLVPLVLGVETKAFASQGMAQLALLLGLFDPVVVDVVIESVVIE
jgi:hypothetical protein